MKLIIDGNSLLNVVASSQLHSSSVSTNITRPFFRVHDKLIIKDDAAEYYNAQVYKYIKSIFNGLTNIDYVCIAIDNVSWRKIFYSKYLEEFKDRPDFCDIKTGYKGHRKIDSELKEQLKELVKYLSNDTLINLSKKVPGIQMVSIKGLEGDDIVYLLTDYYKKTDDVVVWTNDSDITDQVLDKNVYVIGSNDNVTKKRKLFRLKIENKIETSISENMNFNFINSSYGLSDIKSQFDELLKRGYYTELDTDPNYEVFTKILCGDKQSDNIPCVFCVLNDKDKIVNITRAKYSDKIYNYLTNDLKMSSSDIIRKLETFDVDLLHIISTKVCELFKIEQDDNLDKIKTYLKFNIRLIRLSVHTIPKELSNYLYECLNCFTNSKFYLDSYVNYVKDKKYMSYENNKR